MLQGLGVFMRWRHDPGGGTGSRVAGRLADRLQQHRCTCPPACCTKDEVQVTKMGFVGSISSMCVREREGS